MKLSDIKTTDNMKVLIYGNSGVGKTCAACSWPTPILYLDFDNKVDSAAAFYSADKKRLEEIEVRDLSAKLDQDPIEELLRIIDKELIPQQKAGAMKYKTLVVDSLTTFSAAVLAHIVKTNPGVKRVITKQGQQPGMQDFGILKREFARLIPGILSLPMNVIMLAHIKVDRDETTGELVRGPHMDGSFASELPVYFKEVYRMYVEGKKYLAQTQSDVRYNCRTQIPRLPETIELKYDNLIKEYK